MPRRTRTVSRRELLRLFAAATALAAVSGCGGAATPTAVAEKAAGGDAGAGHGAAEGHARKSGLHAGFGPTFVIKDRLVNLADPGGRRYLRFSAALEFAEHHEAASAAGPDGYANPWSHLVTDTSDLPPSRSQLVSYTPDTDGGYQPTTGGGKDADKEFQASIKKYVPAMEDSVMAVLSAKAYADVGTGEGRESVKAEIQERLNGLLEGTDLSVSNVYFTDFVIQ